MFVNKIFMAKKRVQENKIFLLQLNKNRMDGDEPERIQFFCFFSCVEYNNPLKGAASFCFLTERRRKLFFSDDIINCAKKILKGFVISLFRF